jgi:2-methylcitrate dehydratase PrpD
MALADWLHSLTPADVPADVRHQLRRHALDTCAVLAAGARTETGRVFLDHAARWAPAGETGARLAFDGRRASLPTAAWAMGGALDAFDAHDGHPLAKGHVSAGVWPAVLALSDELAPCALDEALLRLLVGSEIGLRAGLALHRLAPAYHTSGAWNALGAAAAGARALGLDAAATGHALGAAEFYGPRGLMMRVIAEPSMLKDGSAAGAGRGVEAALLAADGFRATPAELLTSPDVADLWADLGTRWRVLEQYLKPTPVCRWAQPAVEAAMALRRRVDPARIAQVRVASFAEAVALAGAAPADGDAAQYALAFPVAAALIHGRLGAEEIDGPGLHDSRVLDLARRIALIAEDRFDRRFPAERWCALTVTLQDGTVLDSGEVTTRGDAAAPLEDDELRAKAATLMGADRADAIAALLLDEDGDQTTAALWERLVQP